MSFNQYLDNLRVLNNNVIEASKIYFRSCPAQSEKSLYLQIWTKSDDDPIIDEISW